MAPVLGYWDGRGRAEPMRLLLNYVGAKFEDKRYQIASPDYKKSDWFKIKYSLGLEFPNLPYYIDGDVKMTQSMAILRYLARKHGLSSQNEEEQWKLEMVEQQLADLNSGVMADELYVGNAEEYKTKYVKLVPEKVKPLADFLGQKKWLMGDRLTYVDFLAYDSFDLHRIMIPDIYKPHPNIESYLSRFEKLRGVKDYMASPAFHRLPLWA